MQAGWDYGPKMRKFVVVALVSFVALAAGCKAKSEAATPDAQAPVAQTAAATASTAPTASASAAPSAKPASSNQPKAVKGCPDGWTRTTKGVCVDWCEKDDDCDDDKTCQDSPHIDPDLGKIKTCQPSKAAAVAKCGSTVSDEVVCPTEECAAGFVGGKTAIGTERRGSCLRLCKTNADCVVKDDECTEGNGNLHVCVLPFAKMK